MTQQAEGRAPERVALRGAKRDSSRSNETDTALRCAARATWEKFLQDPPPPMFHGLWPATRMGHMRVEGDIKRFMPNHDAPWRTLEVMREPSLHRSLRRF